jgi:hypothetical protein
MKHKLEDYETCWKCGHIGILHEHGKRGCTALKSLEFGHTGTYCGCKVKRNLEASV